MTEDEFGRGLRRARAVAGLSRAQVATALAVRRSDVARLEHGRRLVTTVELTRLARLYRKPSARCLLEPADPQPLQRFRSGYRLDDRDLMVIEQVADWLAYYAWLERSAFGAQRYRFPTYPPLGGEPTEHGERLAAEERDRLGLRGADAVGSMVALLEREGVKVAVQGFHTRSRVSGCFLFAEDLGPCVILNRNRPPADRRFAAAHGYAHLLLDQEDVSGAVCGPFRAHELDELRADAFAAAFLSPPGGITTVDRRADADDGEGEPQRFRWVAVEAWRCGRISTGKLARLLDLPESDVALLLDQPPFEYGRLDRVPSAESDRL
jgi:transcriptional regulator with XRE-family HTH domain/predicted HTH domain antitoxin